MTHSTHIFPFNEFWPVYVLFSLGVSIVLWLSLRAFGQQPHEVSIREATVSALSWLGMALLFNMALYGFTLWYLQGAPAVAASLGSTPDALARQTALEFLSGYLLEKSLAVDNLFVFLVIFNLICADYLLVKVEDGPGILQLII